MCLTAESVLAGMLFQQGGQKPLEVSREKGDGLFLSLLPCLSYLMKPWLYSTSVFFSFLCCLECDQIKFLPSVMTISSLIFFFFLFYRKHFSTIKSLPGCSYIIFKVTGIRTESASLIRTVVMEMKMPQQDFILFFFSSGFCYCTHNS